VICNQFNIGLAKTTANYVPLTPLSSLARGEPTSLVIRMLPAD
jgi:hypothetical protein